MSIDITRFSMYQVNKAILGLTPSDTTQLIFSTEDDAGSNYVRNTSCFASGLDLTCLAALAGGSRQHGGVAVSPRHVIQANHFGTGIGSTLRFVANDNTIVERTIVATQQIGVTDVLVCQLSSDLPASITPAMVLPANWNAFVPINVIPTIAVNQFKQARVQWWTGEDPATDTNGVLIEYSMQTQSPINGWIAWYIDDISGDSGSPKFIWLDSTPILLCCLHFVDGGPSVSHYANQINAAMSVLGGGHLTIALN